MTPQTFIIKDSEAKKLIVTRWFKGTPDKVWQAWTDAAELDKWWAPKPWKASTKKMDFTEGGTWLYCMKGPNGEQQWSRADFKLVDAPHVYIGEDAFCDADGNVIEDLPRIHWKVSFAESEDGTTVTCELTFKTEEALEKIIEMGFNEGFTAAHSNLDELLAK